MGGSRRRPGSRHRPERRTALVLALSSGVLALGLGALGWTIASGGPGASGGAEEVPASEGLSTRTASPAVEPDPATHPDPAPRKTPEPAPDRAPDPAPGPTHHGIEARVLDVIDGDTIVVLLSGKHDKVRYLGINTPESIPATAKGIEFYGHEASEKNRELVGGRTVELEFDGPRRDPYDRLLAYVWADGRMVNRALVEEGFAEVYREADRIRCFDEFRRLEAAAKKRGQGMWDEPARRRWRG